jgi:hypothetical protein
MFANAKLKIKVIKKRIEAPKEAAKLLIVDKLTF